MISVYFGSDSGIIKSRFYEDIREHRDSLVRYDASDDISDVVTECSMLSLDGSRKYVLLNDASFLSTSRSKRKLTSAEQKDLLSYIRSPEENSDLFIIVPGKLDSTDPLVKALKETAAKLIEVHDPTDDDIFREASSITKKEKKDISKSACLLLWSYSHGDHQLFINDLDKLMLYTDHIRDDDVRLLVAKPLEDKVYDLAEKLVTGKKDSALRSYKELRKNGNNAVSILTSLANQFTFLALTSYLIRSGADDETIAKELSTRGNPVKRGKVYYARRSLRYTTYDSLIDVLSNLGEIEKDIKLNLDSADDLLETFIATY